MKEGKILLFMLFICINFYSKIIIYPYLLSLSFYLNFNFSSLFSYSFRDRLRDFGVESKDYENDEEFEKNMKDLSREMQAAGYDSVPNKHYRQYPDTIVDEE